MMIVIPFWILKSLSSGFNVIKDVIIKVYWRKRTCLCFKPYYCINDVFQYKPGYNLFLLCIILSCYYMNYMY